ncbi:MAG: exo-alpha-sialidase [Xanthomonadales bacterium]|nr:exo-alpha-sialidase [Xanthomonadales bacterium]
MKARSLPFTTSLLLLASFLANAQTSIAPGSGNDYQAAVVRPWEEPAVRIAVFERLDASFSGDLWVTRSDDGGETWDAPEPVQASAANERHPSLVQTAPDRFQLFHLSDATGGFRIHRAESDDGRAFHPAGAIDLGWASPGEINPQVIRAADGTLVLSYHRLGGAAYVARSMDAGASWDSLRTQVSPAAAALPRLTQRAADGRFLLAYQTGSNPVSIWTRSSDDLADWSDPVRLVAGGNNHDAWPLALADGTWAVLWARVDAGAFQIHSSHSADGSAWSAPRAQSDRPGLNNVEPFALPNGAGRVELYWAAGQLPGDADYDIVRVADAVVVEGIFAHGFEEH